MIPKGPGYVHLREEVLTTFNARCHLRMDERSGLKEWLVGQKGSFTVRSSSSFGYELSADSFGLSKHLLVDLELLTNECFEHLQEGFNFYNDTSSRSVAWNIVTVYYFAFYAAQVLLRLLGRPVLYLNKDEAKDFALLAPGSSSFNAGAGAYQMIRTSAPSSGYVEYSLN